MQPFADSSLLSYGQGIGGGAPAQPTHAASASRGHSYFGLIKNSDDAYLIVEACRAGLLPRVTRRLTEAERTAFIRPGAVFCWEEVESGVKRWTDHIRWSPSRVSGPFLMYYEVPNRGADTFVKQSFSITDEGGRRLHLISYFTRKEHHAESLPRPTGDPMLQHLIPSSINLAISCQTPADHASPTTTGRHARGSIDANSNGPSRPTSSGGKSSAGVGAPFTLVPSKPLRSSPPSALGGIPGSAPASAPSTSAGLPLPAAGPPPPVPSTSSGMYGTPAPAGPPVAARPGGPVWAGPPPPRGLPPHEPYLGPSFADGVPARPETMSSHSNFSAASAFDTMSIGTAPTSVHSPKASARSSFAQEYQPRLPGRHSLPQPPQSRFSLPHPVFPERWSLPEAEPSEAAARIRHPQPLPGVSSFTGFRDPWAKHKPAPPEPAQAPFAGRSTEDKRQLELLPRRL